MRIQSPGWHDSLGALQWFVYLLVYSIPIPIVIGGLYHLPAAEVEGLMQRTFLVAGITTVLQGLLGHRRPIVDGPAGIWLSVFVILGDMALRSGGDPANTLSLLTGGMMLAGVILLLISGVAHRIAGWFTPLVTGSFMLLLSIQLGGVFLKGMLGAGHGPLTSSHALPGLIAIGIFLFVFGLSVWGKGWWKSYAVLIGIAVGWLVFSCLGLQQMSAANLTWFRLPEVFLWGVPHLDLGMAVAVFPLILMLLSSTMAATESMDQVLEKQVGEDPKHVFRSTAVSGVTHLLSASFSTVGIVPLGGSAGYVRMTGHRRSLFLGRRTDHGVPFLYASRHWCIDDVARTCCLCGRAGRICPDGRLGSEGHYAGAHDRAETNDFRGDAPGWDIASVLACGYVCSRPAIVQYIVGNGLLVGVLIVLVLERIWLEPDSKGKKSRVKPSIKC